MTKKAAIKKVLACFVIIAILMSTIPTSAQPTGTLKIYVKNEADSYQSGAEVVRYESNWDYIDTKTTSSSGYVLWSGISTGTYKYEVYYSGEFWGGGEETVSSGSTTTKDFQKYTPYVDSVSIKDVNGNAKTTFAPGEMVHVDVTLKNPGWVDYYTKATLRIDQDKTASYTLEETHGPVYTYAGDYAYFGWDWNIPTTASGTYYINPLALMDISNKYILTDDAGWSWSFDVVQSTATLTYRVHNIGTDPLPGAGGSITVKVYDSSTLVTQDTKNFNGGASHLDFSFTLNSGKTYRFKTHQTPSIGLQLEEYWGYKDVAVSSSDTVNFNRNLPYVNFVGTYTQLDVGQSVVPKVTLYNPNSGTLSGKAKLIIDQSKSSLYDYEQKSSSASISGSSSRDYDMLSFSPSSTGTYYYYAVAYAYTDGAYRITDQSVWPEYVDVVQPTGRLIGRVTDSSGKDINGATVTLGSWTTTTDNTAHYIFIDKTKREYDFKVEKTGYNTYTGTATVGSGTTTKDVQLTTWQSPEIELTPSSHDFGEVQTTVSTAPFSFTLKNVGGGTATGEVSLTGSGKDQFIITSGKGSFSLDADQTKTIGVAFSPTSAGSKSATLYAKGSNCNDDQSSLSGTGEEGVSTLSADFSIEPSQNINLGDVVTFDPSLSSGDILLYHWDFGDGETEPPTSFPDKIKHLYKSSGTFTVKLKVSTADGNSKSLAKTVNVNSKYANSILINYLVYKDITLVDYTFNAIYTKYAPINVRIEKYSNSNVLPVVVVGNAIKNQPLDYITVNKICEEIAVQGVLYLIKEAGYSVTGIGGILNLIRVVDFIDFIQGYNFIEFDVTNDNGDLTVYLPYESARFDKTEPIGDQTPMGEDSINNKINKQISTPDNLQFQETPEQLIYVSKPDIGLSEDTDQKFAYIKKINPLDIPKSLTFYYEPLKKVEKAVSLLPKLRISVKREIYRHSPVLKPKHLKDVPLIGVPIRVDGKDIGSTSSGGVLEVTEADLNKFGISPFGSHSLEAGDGTFYSKKTVQFDFTNEGMTKVDIVLDKCKLPDTPSYATIIIETPTNYPDSVIYPHAKSIENFINNKGILAEDLHAYDIFVDAKCIIAGSDWIVVLFHSENVDNDYRLHNPGGFLAYVDTKPTKPLRSGSGWQIIRYEYKSVDTEDILQHVYCIVYSEDKTDTVETAVKEFFEIMEQEFRGSDGLNQLIPTSIETSPDPPSTNFGTVPKDQTRTWDFFITNSGSGTLTWAITCDQPSWLNVNPAIGSTTTLDVVTVTIDTHDLSPGTYTGHITIDSNGGRKIGTITVNVPSKPSTPDVGFKGIVLFPCTYSDFTGQGIEVTKILSDPNSKLANSKNICTYWTEDTLAQIDTVAPGDEVEVYGTLIEAQDVAEVWMIVRLETSTHYIVRLKQGPPQLRTWPTTLLHDFGTVAKDQTRTWDFDVTNCGSGTLTWSVSDDKNWISVYPTSGSTTTERDTVTVRIDTQGLSPGTYTGHITLTSNGGEKTGTITVVVPKPQNQPPEKPTLTPDRLSPQLAGTTIKWTASATDPDGDTLYYQFRLKGPATGNSWQIKRDWSTARTWTWYTTASDVGESDISVRIRDGHHAQASSYDLKKTVYDYKITADKKRPTATIDSITPNPATQGDDTVRFKGHGYDSDGYIVEYYWKSSKDGKLSSSKEFTKSASNLDVGTHTISFKVKDDDGQWSDWATATLKIKEKKEESKYVKFRGVVTGTGGNMGLAYWYVTVDEWISGSLSCDEIYVGWGSGLPHGSFDSDISTGDRVEAYGEVNPWEDDKCSVGLNDESYYIKKV